MRGFSRWFASGDCPVLPAEEAYALWADTYPPWPHNPLMEAEQSVVGPMLTSAQPRRGLDVGTGTGRNLALLQSAGARLVVGVDLSMAMLAHALPAARTICANACRLPFADASFDLVCSSLMVGDVERLADWVAEAARVLAPACHLVYSDFHPSWGALGWRRTFTTADGRTFALPYHRRTIEEHLGLIDAAGLEVLHIREPRVEGRPSPVIVAFHATKPGPFVVERQRRWPR
jgi:SAM-dependent methyltransferase